MAAVMTRDFRIAGRCSTQRHRRLGDAFRRRDRNMPALIVQTAPVYVVKVIEPAVAVIVMPLAPTGPVDVCPAAATEEATIRRLWRRIWRKTSSWGEILQLRAANATCVMVMRKQRDHKFKCLRFWSWPSSQAGGRYWGPLLPGKRAAASNAVAGARRAGRSSTRPQSRPAMPRPAGKPNHSPGGEMARAGLSNFQFSFVTAFKPFSPDSLTRG